MFVTTTLRRMLFWDVIARLFIALDLVHQGWLSLVHPESLASRVLSSGGEDVGDVIGWGMVIMAAVIVIDVAINDIASDRYAFSLTRRLHHLFYLFAGGLFIAQSLVAFAAPDLVLDDPWLPTIYLGRGLVCGLVAWRFSLGKLGWEMRRGYDPLPPMQDRRKREVA